MAVVSNPYTFSITSNKTVRVNISRKTYTVTLGPANHTEWKVNYQLQYYNFTYKDPDTGTSTTKKVVNDTVTLTLKYGTTWTAVAGLIDQFDFMNTGDFTPSDSGTITGALTLAIEDAWGGGK
jgi:hypothetical protein